MRQFDPLKMSLCPHLGDASYGLLAKAPEGFVIP